MYLSKKKKCHKLYSEMKGFMKQNSQINTHVLCIHNQALLASLSTQDTITR